MKESAKAQLQLNVVVEEYFHPIFGPTVLENTLRGNVTRNQGRHLRTDMGTACMVQCHAQTCESRVHIKHGVTRKLK